MFDMDIHETISSNEINHNSNSIWKSTRYIKPSQSAINSQRYIDCTDRMYRNETVFDDDDDDL